MTKVWIVTVALAATTAMAPGTAIPASAAAAVQLTGTQLESGLLPASGFPAGYVISNVSDSGSHRQSSRARYNLATMTCSTWQHDGGSYAVFGATASATDLAVPAHAGTASPFEQDAVQFATASAASRYFSDLRAILLRCRRYSQREDGNIVTTTIRVIAAPPVHGHPAFWADTTYVPAGQPVGPDADFLYTTAGTDVTDVVDLGGAGNSPASPATPVLLGKLLTRVLALYRVH
jgi:hypothetical protein